MVSVAFLQSSNSVTLPIKAEITWSSQYVLITENTVVIIQLSSKQNYTKFRLAASKHTTRYGGDFVQVLMPEDNSAECSSE